MPYLYATEFHHTARKSLPINQLYFLLHLHTDGVFLHFRSTFQSLGQCLL